jgi:hypothetical protein
LIRRNYIFAGRILGIRTIFSFHGETVAQLREQLGLIARPLIKNLASMFYQNLT